MDNSGNNEIVNIDSIKLLHKSWIRRKKKIYFSSSNIFFNRLLKDPSDCTSFSESGSLFQRVGDDMWTSTMGRGRSISCGSMCTGRKKPDLLVVVING